MSARPSLDDYIDVAERIQHFKEQHPDGTLQTVDWSVVEVAGKAFIVYQAAAFRNPDDPRPGHGIAWEPFPGPTPYTKDSELMNAETAAWGRAIVAVGLAANRKIASRQEVRSRRTEPTQASQPTADAGPKLASEKQRNLIALKADQGKVTGDVLANILLVVTANEPRSWPGEKEASEWATKALERLPAAKVDAVLENIHKESIGGVAA